jgi:hypothetical protein
MKQSIDYDKNHEAVEKALEKGLLSLPLEVPIYNVHLLGLYGIENCEVKDGYI